MSTTDTSSSVKTAYRLCPKCRKGLLDERVPRARLVKQFFGFLPLKRYLCRKCMRKTYVLESSTGK